jgi:hypothetical protein
MLTLTHNLKSFHFLKTNLGPEGYNWLDIGYYKGQKSFASLFWNFTGSKQQMHTTQQLLRTG